MSKRICSVDGCERAHRARGYCGSHYNQILFPDRHKRTTTVPCAGCGKSVERRLSEGRSRRTVCSYDCRSKLQFGEGSEHHRKREKERRAHFVDRRQVAGPIAPIYGPWPAPVGWVDPFAQRVPAARRLFVQGACAVCGDAFMAVNSQGGHTSRYCSSRCSRTAHKGSGWISASSRAAIYERDGWKCQICFRPTKRTYDHSDPDSPTLDHVLPRARGGSDDPENLRLAHAMCNAVRGDDSQSHVLGMFALS